MSTFHCLNDWVIQTINDLRKTGIVLSEHGNDAGWNSCKTIDRIFFDIDKIGAAIEDIPKTGFWVRTEHTNRMLDSVVLKRKLENWWHANEKPADFSISNGDFILAMIYLGFTPSWNNGHLQCVNSFFNLTSAPRNMITV